MPRPAGVVAVHWWLHTGGAPDEIRGLPALPGPQDALAVIAAGDRYLFLVQAGAITGGMKWKAESILAALAGGVERVHVLDGRQPHTVIAELFTDRGVGSLVQKGPVAS